MIEPHCLIDGDLRPPVFWNASHGRVNGFAALNYPPYPWSKPWCTNPRNDRSRRNK